MWHPHLQARPLLLSLPPICHHCPHQVGSVVASLSPAQLVTCHPLLHLSNLQVVCLCDPGLCHYPLPPGSVAASLFLAQLPGCHLLPRLASLQVVHLLMQCPHPRPMVSTEVPLTLYHLKLQIRHLRPNQVRLLNFTTESMLKLIQWTEWIDLSKLDFWMRLALWHPVVHHIQHIREATLLELLLLCPHSIHLLWPNHSHRAWPITLSQN